MASKQLVTLSGAVEQINAKGNGIKLLGDWLNISQYHPIAPMPTPGEFVEVQVEQTDIGAWINSLKIIGATAASAERELELARGRLEDELYQREIRRLECLKAAATFAAGKCLGGSADIKTGDVLKVAEAFERWVLGGGEASA